MKSKQVGDCKSLFCLVAVTLSIRGWGSRVERMVLFRTIDSKPEPELVRLEDVM
jgi:hypothetical protein